MAVNIETDFDVPNVVKQARKSVKLGMNKAGVFLVGETRKSLNVGVRAGARGDKTITRSKPGEPPRKETARLFRSVTHKIEENKKEVRLRLGTSTPYGRRLELGFVGTDSAGRSINQAPRPHLRPAIANNRQNVLRLISSGSRKKT